MVNLFGGTGFIGRHYANLYHSIINDRDDYVPKTNQILYLISTTDNYNIYTNPSLDIETNLTVLMRVLENCRGRDIVFNFASSWFVYDINSAQPAPESSLCRPQGFYSITKHTAEQLLSLYCNTFGIKYRILRFGNVVGPGDKNASIKKNILTYMIKQLQENQEIELWSSGQFYRDYIDVEDLCRAVNLVMKKAEFNTIYNISNGIPILFKDAIDYAAQKIGSKSKIILDNKHSAKSFWLNCGKLRNLGYTPQYSIYQTIDKLL